MFYFLLLFYYLTIWFLIIPKMKRRICKNKVKIQRNSIVTTEWCVGWISFRRYLCHFLSIYLRQFWNDLIYKKKSIEPLPLSLLLVKLWKKEQIYAIAAFNWWSFLNVLNVHSYKRCYKRIKSYSLRSDLEETCRSYKYRYSFLR